jgi:predicted DNA binding protein
VSVIAEVNVSAAEFELGRILELEPGERLELETMVPLGQEAVPFFLVHDQARETFEGRVRNHPSVEQVQELERHDTERLYMLRWNTSSDHFFEAMAAVDAQLMMAKGSTDTWQFEVRFPSHGALSEFGELCDSARIEFGVERVYNPTKPTLGQWYGLSEQQRQTLVRAVQRGYYSIPRQVSTQDLAEEFGISDQAVTERLRRAIATLTKNTVIVPPEPGDGTGD